MMADIAFPQFHYSEPWKKNGYLPMRYMERIEGYDAEERLSLTLALSRRERVWD